MLDSFIRTQSHLSIRAFYLIIDYFALDLVSSYTYIHIYIYLYMRVCTYIYTLFSLFDRHYSPAHFLPKPPSFVHATEAFVRSYFHYTTRVNFDTQGQNVHTSNASSFFKFYSVLFSFVQRMHILKRICKFVIPFVFLTFYLLVPV